MEGLKFSEIRVERVECCVEGESGYVKVFWRKNRFTRTPSLNYPEVFTDYAGQKPGFWCQIRSLNQQKPTIPDYVKKKPSLNISFDAELDATLTHLHALLDPPNAFTSPTSKRRRRIWLVKYLLEEAAYAVEDHLQERGTLQLPLRFVCEKGSRRGKVREQRNEAIEELLRNSY
jgi:hypothetical protein